MDEYLSLINQLLTAPEEDYETILLEQPFLINPTLDQEIIRLREEASTNTNLKEELTSLQNSILPFVHNYGLYVWFSITDDVSKNKMADLWIMYLVNKEVSFQWKILLNEPQYESSRDIVNKNYLVVQRKAVNLLFELQKQSVMEFWCEHAAFFMLSPQALLLSPFYNSNISSENHANAYYTWGILYSNDRNVTTTDVNLNAIIHCFNKALGFFKYDLYPEMWLNIQLNLADAYKNKQEQFEDGTQTIESAIEIYEDLLTKFHNEDNYFNDLVNEATILIELAALYLKRPSKSKAEDIETCIRLLTAADSVNKAKDEVLLNFYLARAYSQRVNGLKENNLEKSKEAYEKALSKCENDESKNFFIIKNNLSDIYLKRITGSKPNNIDKAIELCETALEKIDKDRFPDIYYLLCNNLGNGLALRESGDAKENDDQAIAAFAKMDSAFKNNYREEWICSRLNLGNLYFRKVSKNKSENIEKSISIYGSIIYDFTIEEFPENWLLLRLMLAKSYSSRQLGVRQKNESIAVGVFEAALSNLKRVNFSTIENFDNIIFYTAYANFCTRRSFGNIEENIEKAIELLEIAYKLALENCRDYHLAEIQIDLAYAFFKRIKHDKAANIEYSISVLEHLIPSINNIKFRQLWHLAYINLGLAYHERIRGNRAENIESAIRANEKALETISLKKEPYDWALITNNLGKAYSDRIVGNKKQNIEKAISLFNESLQVRSQDSFPNEWALTQMSLGYSFNIRIQGDPIDNQEKAIKFYENALIYISIETQPNNWGIIQNNLGRAFSNRTIGVKSQNIDRSIKAFQSALLIFEKDLYPNQWAKIQVNLANVLNIDENESMLNWALTCYHLALQVHTRIKFPYEWAIIQYDLGVLYTTQRFEDIGTAYEKAISYFENSLKVRTKENFPYDWARVQLELGNAYANRKKGEQKENIEKAFKCYEEALEVYRPLIYPDDCLKASTNYGSILYHEKRYKEAIQILEIAHHALENIRSQTSISESKEKIAATYHRVYPILIECCIVEKNFEKAFKYVGAFKGRSLIEKITSDRPDRSKSIIKDPGLAQSLIEIENIWQQIEELRIKLNGISNEGGSTNETKLSYQKEYDELELLNQKRKRKLEQINYLFPIQATTISVPPISIEAAKKLSAELSTTIIEFFKHENNWIAFIIKLDQFCSVVLPETAEVSINDALDIILLYEKGLPALYGEITQKAILQDLYQNFIIPLNSFLPEQGTLLIAPHGLLHFIPIGLMQDKNGRCFFEKYEITYTVSTGTAHALHQQRQKKEEKPKNKSAKVMIVEHPGFEPNKLEYTLQEVAEIKKVFQSNVLLDEKSATPSSVITTLSEQSFSAVHFSCHGGFDFYNPDLSCLVLNGRLTVEKIINELNITDQPLIVLSACQTGRARLHIGGELTGITQALFQSGAGNIIASLWSINDESTMYLFKSFYNEWIQSNESDCVALRKAMLDVKTMPPYKSAFYWGAFQVYGLPSSS